jgi:ubiquitin C-terminal hydrolase
MEGDNAYLCEELGRRVPAVKRAAIKHLPQMLCVHLKRFEFDYHNMVRLLIAVPFWLCAGSRKIFNGLPLLVPVVAHVDIS